MLITKNIESCRFRRSNHSNEETKNGHKLGVPNLIA
jgi:hypothetical protein